MPVAKQESTMIMQYGSAAAKAECVAAPKLDAQGHVTTVQRHKEFAAQSVGCLPAFPPFNVR